MRTISCKDGSQLRPGRISAQDGVPLTPAQRPAQGTHHGSTLTQAASIADDAPTLSVNRYAECGARDMLFCCSLKGMVMEALMSFNEAR